MSHEAAVRPALEFVAKSGTPFDQALLKVLLQEDLGDGELAALTEPQNPDGGFRVRELSKPLSVVGRTAEMLTYLVAVGAGEYGAAQAAADFLIERQRPDGTWGEDDALREASPPAHFQPGSPFVIAWETAATVVALSGLGLPLDFRQALDYLRVNRVSPSQPRVFKLEALLLYPAFRRLEGDAAPATAALRAEVGAFPTASLEVFELNWGLMALSLAEVPASEKIIRSFGAALASKQRPDGSFGTGPSGSALETVLALCALESAGVARLPRRERQMETEPDPADSARTI
jgi:prenyltransferase/squalene oxidase-like repeat protein